MSASIRHRHSFGRPTPWDDDDDRGDPDALLGTTLAGRYRITGLLGEGGMGRVYRAEHLRLGRVLAIKVLAVDRGVPRAEARFALEAEAMARIGHPNIVDVLDFGETASGACFLVMEHLEGEDLGALLDREGAQPWPRVREIVVQICRGLQAAHDRGIVHRDIKPENCFLTQRGEQRDFVKLLDFGVAKLTGRVTRRLTRTGNLLGTPEYMAPEQARGGDIDHRADVYAAGMVMYELLTGSVPFTGDSFMGVLLQQLNDPVPAPSQKRPDLAIAAELDAIVLRALAKSPADRFQSAAELAAAIAAVRDDAIAAVTVTAPAQGSEHRVTSVHAPRSRAAWSLAPALALAFAAGVGAIVWTAAAEPEPTPVQHVEVVSAIEPKPADVPTPVQPQATTPVATRPSAVIAPLDQAKRAPTSERVGPRPRSRPSSAQIDAAMRDVNSVVKLCAGSIGGGTRGDRVKVKLTVTGSGDVIAARALGEHADTKVGRCVERAAGQARFAAFPGERASVVHTFAL